MIEFFIVMGIILLLSMGGYFAKGLTLSGSIAAFFVGLFIWLGFRVEGFFLLGIFFITSSFWSKYKKPLKAPVEDMLAKGDRRDWQQVIANGGAAAICSIIYVFGAKPVWLFAFAVLMASSNSDTWASEIGTLSKSSPISIRTFSHVPKGTSGAVSVLGTIAGIFGAFIIAISSYFLFPFRFKEAFFVFLFGFLGNVFDTIFGAFVQGTYKCVICNKETEKKFHCGKETKLVKGIPFLNNDVINFSSGILAAIIGCFIYSLWICP